LVSITLEAKLVAVNVNKTTVKNILALRKPQVVLSERFFIV
jgi:hypothetical protein